ncbi:ammonium transporter Mep2p [[Candida] jaroonii]|uniref:Ammonium transporter Mep2p n=1 Tax=[Candida] jaroonii TaxID=467808 RepID=A0ACA9YBV2_9ASCO|nr:ammonium transporter Mep2p [[Candida] jaroonii]
MEKRYFDVENQTVDVDKAEMVYILFCASAVFLITPGIGLYYGGVLKRNSVVQIMFQSLMITAAVTVLWYLIGYSLANSASGSVMIGNLASAALHSEEAKPLFEGATIPSIANFCFNTYFPVATIQIFVGSIGERGRFLPSLVIGLIFTLVVYCPQAYWVWGGNGWLLNLGELDFAGGGPVHISSGVASLVYSIYLGPRDKSKRFFAKASPMKPHSMFCGFVGVVLINFGWLSFNPGTLLAVNARTAYIFANTMIASSTGCLTYVLVDKMITGKYSLIASWEGIIVGLVNITPSCGYYYPWAAFLTTVITAVGTRYLLIVSEKFVDDSSRAWPVHGIAGILGGTLTGIFASKTIAAADGVTEIDGGWVNGNFRQLGIQIASWVVITLWTASFTAIICFLVDHIPGLKVRASEAGEEMGMDLYEMAETLDEFGNNYDEFFLSHAKRLREIADALEKGSGTVELLEGSSPTSSPRNSHTSINIDYQQKV